MKFSKKLLALLMVFTMVFGLSVTAFAAPVGEDGKIPIEVRVVNGNSVSTQTVRLVPNVSLYEEQDETIEYNGTATAIDALIASGVMGNYFAVEYLDTTTWQGTGIYGLAFDEINGISGYSVPEGNQTRYYYWDLAIKTTENGSYVHTDNYATHYKASDIYGVQVTLMSMLY